MCLNVNLMYELSSVFLVGLDILVFIMRGKSWDIFYRCKYICDLIIIVVNSFLNRELCEIWCFIVGLINDIV